MPQNLSSTLPSQYRRWGFGYVSILAIAAIIYSLLSLWAFPQIDDCMFMSVYRSYNNLSNDFNIQSWIEMAKETRNNDNSRLCNFVSIFTTIISPTNAIFPWINGLMTAGLIAFTTAFWRQRNHRATVACIAWGILLIALPWRDCLFIRDYSLNYIVASFITLSFIATFVRYEDKGWTKSATILMALFAIPTGLWSEGFTVTTCFGIGIYGLTNLLRKNKKSPSTQFYLIFAIYILAGLWITFSPGVLARTNREVPLAGNINLFKYLVFMAPSFLAILLLILNIGSTRLRQAFKNPYFIIFACTAISGTVLTALVNHTPRTSFWPTLCSIIYLGILYRKAITRFMDKGISKYLAVTILLTCIASGVYSDIYQHRLYEEYLAIIHKIERSKSGSIYHDIIFPERCSRFSLYMPTRTCWVTPFHYYCLQDYYHKAPISVVPTDLLNINQEKEVINSDSTIFRTGSALWTSFQVDPKEQSQVLVSLKMKNGQELQAAMGTLLQFITKEGAPFTYIKLYNIDARDIAEITSFNPM